MIRKNERRADEVTNVQLTLSIKGRHGSPGRLTQEEARRKLTKFMESTPPRSPNLTWKDIESEMGSIFGDRTDPTG